MKTNVKDMILIFFVLIITTSQMSVQASEYELDRKGVHAFIQFKIKHLGYSWLLGRFNRFDGHFSYNKNTPDDAEVVVNIDPSSIDSNHAERDKHLRGKDFLDVKKYPEAKFISTAFKEMGEGKAILTGNLTLHGVTKEISMDVEHIGHGSDPWGGYRRGFSATTVLILKDFNIDFDLGPASRQVELFISVEGIRSGGDRN